MAEHLQLGSRQKLAIEFWLDSSETNAEPGLAWGEMRVWLAGTCVWCQPASKPILPVEAEAEPIPVRWTWVELLQGMARIWPWLYLEEGYPLSVSPEHPGKLMEVAEARWQELSHGQAEAEEDVLFDFRQRHDLSMLLRGISLPPLWWVKEGREAIFWSPEVSEPVRMPQSRALELWRSLGDFLCNALVEETALSRASEAVRRWQGRGDAESEHFLPLVSGMDWPALAELAETEDRGDIARFLECRDSGKGDLENGTAPGNELLMVARMTTGYVGVEHQRQILLTIKQLPHRATPELDALSQLAPTPSEGTEAWQQGYDLAHWLRRQLGVESFSFVDPERWLRDWGCALQHIDLPVPLDALAAWGPSHGPAILYNINQLSRSAFANGRRTALAHEICHLLIDRQGALPMAEVLRGAAPRWAEKRANAFAAELLLPREIVADRVVSSDDLLFTLKRLEEQFRVSRELICHQLFNSSIGQGISHGERQRLESWKRVE